MSRSYTHEVRHLSPTEDADEAVRRAQGGAARERTIIEAHECARHIGFSMTIHYTSGAARGDLVFLDPDSARLLGRKLIEIADALGADYGA